MRLIPFADPGVPDTRSGLRLILWLEHQQLRGQAIAVFWGLIFFGGIAAAPIAVGLAVQAVIDRSWPKLILSGVLLLVFGAAKAGADSFFHRAVVSNWICTASRLQQLLMRKASELGSLLTRRIAAGEVVAVSSGDVEKIGWFVEVLGRFTAALLTSFAVVIGLLFYEPQLGLVVAIAVPVLAFSIVPLMGPAERRADAQRAKGGRATELAADTVAGLRVLRGIGGEQLFLDRYRAASQEYRASAVRSARMWSLIAALQVLLFGLFLVLIVWMGVRMVASGRITVGELVTTYGFITFLLVPLHTFEETASAFIFSKVSAKRAARVLSLQRTDDTMGTAAAQLPDGDLYDPVSGLLVPAVHRSGVGQSGCGRSAGRPSRWAQPDSRAGRGVGAAGWCRPGRSAAGFGAHGRTGAGQGPGAAVWHGARAVRRTGEWCGLPGDSTGGCTVRRHPRRTASDSAGW
ncbi:hypothetical protein GCM10029976_058670 [Kribbella albertanoniae]